MFFFSAPHIWCIGLQGLKFDYFVRHVAYVLAQLLEEKLYNYKITITFFKLFFFVLTLYLNNNL